MTDALCQVAELVRRETGIVLKPAQDNALTAALRRAVPGVDAAGFLWLASDAVEGRVAIDRLIDEVTIKETSFLRDQRQLEAISWRALLENARAAGSDTIRVWTAGCATGEEAYTLAMLASEAFAPGVPPVDILATDISVTALAAAAEGRYRERPVRAVGPDLRARYFESDGDRLVVGERLRRLVRFQRHNLVSDATPPLGEAPFDLIACRNVLIYFDGPTVESVISGLERALRADGMLMLGAADALCGTARRLSGYGDGTLPDRRAPRTSKPLRRPLGRIPQRRFEDRLAHALTAAGTGRTADALAQVSKLLAEQPLNADVYFLRGLVELESDDAGAAIASLRRALYIDPSFGLAAFTLGRAHDAAGDERAALRAYEHALRTLDSDGERHELILEQVDLGDVAAACRARLAALR